MVKIQTYRKRAVAVVHVVASAAAVGVNLFGNATATDLLMIVHEVTSLMANGQKPSVPLERKPIVIAHAGSALLAISRVVISLVVNVLLGINLAGTVHAVIVLTVTALTVKVLQVTSQEVKEVLAIVRVPISHAAISLLVTAHAAVNHLATNHVHRVAENPIVDVAKTSL